MLKGKTTIVLLRCFLLFVDIWTRLLDILRTPANWQKWTRCFRTSCLKCTPDFQRGKGALSLHVVFGKEGKIIEGYNGSIVWTPLWIWIFAMNFLLLDYPWNEFENLLEHKILDADPYEIFNVYLKRACHRSSLRRVTRMREMILLLNQLWAGWKGRKIWSHRSSVRSACKADADGGKSSLFSSKG